MSGQPPKSDDSGSKPTAQPSAKSTDQPTDKPIPQPSSKQSFISRFTPRFKLKPNGKITSPIWLWLAILLLCSSLINTLLVLLMVYQRYLAIAGIAILLLLPTITTLTDYSLTAWGYVLSGVVIFAALIFWAKASAVTLIIAAIIWMGIIAIPITVEKMIGASFSRVTTIIILSMVCLLGLAIAWLTVWFQS
ncbi:PT domain-containing protein [Tumidithrix elongata RA019]|uniref:PT domain-containing protein n=1 Tax=Tumidithrix elongata BACA0141 TaxID=2716417 RepID=A0AAW9Q1T8_9CYAN|nr:PT domain-containing protein [Tumidithrix elongata RA019]